MISLIRENKPADISNTEYTSNDPFSEREYSKLL
jgi:hypothetical protein